MSGMRGSVGWVLGLVLLGGVGAVDIWPTGVMAQVASASEVDQAMAEGFRLFKEGSTESLRKALLQFERAARLSRGAKQEKTEAMALLLIGIINNNLGEKPKALEFYNQSLLLWRAVGDRSGEATTLNNIGLVYSALGEKPKALEFYNQSLPLWQAVGDRSGEATTLNNIGRVYDALGEKPKALEFYNQSLPLRRAVGDRSGEATTLNNIGLVYSDLGDKPKALEFYNQSLLLWRAVGDRSGEASTLNNIGRVYDDLGDKPKALEFYNQSLPTSRAVGDRSGEASTLNNIGLVYSDLGDKPKALESYHQSLPLWRAVGDRYGEASTLNNIGRVYDALGDKPKALEFYNQSLPLSRAVGDRSGEATTLSNIGYLLNGQQQPELAVVFYKQSVSVYESLRASNQILPRELRESQTKTFADTYRALADILLAHNRVLEAQQILDLLKVQELNDYLKNVRGNAQALYELPPEQAILKKYNALQTTALALGQQLTALQTKAKKGSLNAADQQRKAQLVALQNDLNQQFNSFTQSPDIQALVHQLSDTAREQTIPLARLDAFRTNLRQLNAVMLYPLILPDRLELIITTPDSPPLRRTVNVKREDLNKAIAEFRAALQNPHQDPKPAAQKLYQWLIKPLESDLNQAQAQTIIYAPDDQLRYIPLGALHNGQQWLIQQYRINNITAQSLTEFKTQPINQPHVLAGAFASGSYTIQSGERRLFFGGLPAAGVEINRLAALLPGTTKLVDKAFSRTGTTSQMNDFNIVHFATHASFAPGSATNSFILFGNGDTASLKDIESWTLNNVDLVVLSACETGLGGKFGNGEEILGLGYQFQNRGAKAVISSLWQVDDGGTQALMDAFYAALKTGKLTKSAALQQAQQALITKAITPETNAQNAARASASRYIPGQIPVDGFTHPYYWAPFILIGNGL
jgi:CHAT domain-containing protein/tetratricopeptide (TPR) repeat protein